MEHINHADLKYLTYKMLSNSSAFCPPIEYFFREGLEIDNYKYLKYIKQRNNGLYVHIPFCVTVCNYCACNHKELQQDDNMDKYVTYILKEISLIYELNDNQILSFDSIMFGGGTPSILPNKLLDKLFKGLHKYIDFTMAKQVSFEASPYTITKSKIDILKKFGVDRISMGIQSLDKDVLKLNNRPFMSESLLSDLIEYIMSRDIKLHIDLMIGIKGQNMKNILSTYKFIYNLRVDHITLNYYISHNYSKYTQNQELWNLQEKFRKIESRLPHFNKNLEPLRQEQVFIKDNKYSIIGIGSGATSYLVDYIMYEKFDIYEYYSLLDEGKIPIGKGILLDSKFKYIYIIINALKEYGRIDIGSFAKKYNVDLHSLFKSEFMYLIKHKIISYDDNSIELLKDIEESFSYLSILYYDYFPMNVINDIGIFTHEMDLNLITLIKES